MKKILCLILAVLTLSLQTLPALAEEKFYDFSDEAQAEFDRQQSEIKQSAKTKNKSQEINSEPKLQKVKRKEQGSIQIYEPKDRVEPVVKRYDGTVLYIPAGVEFKAQLQSSISSESLSENDTVAAVLCEDWVYNGHIVAPEGSVLYGKATDVKRAGYAYANGKLALSFEEVMTPAGDRIKLNSNKVYVDVKGNRALKTAGTVAIGAIGGLVTGVLYSLISGGDVVGGMAIGSAIGAAGGGITAATRKGEAAEIPAGRVIIVKLVQGVEVSPYSE